jgi:antitoxin MazE
MHASLVKIGNSQGVRLPKAVIEQAGLGKDLDLEIVDGAVIIRSQKQARAGWAEAARRCREQDDDQLVDWDVTAGEFPGETP